MFSHVKNNVRVHRSYDTNILRNTYSEHELLSKKLFLAMALVFFLQWVFMYDGWYIDFRMIPQVRKATKLLIANLQKELVANLTRNVEFTLDS